MYYADHAPAHFHAQYNEFEAIIRIDNLNIIQGKLPPKAHALVIERAALHQIELQENRERGLRELAFEKIAPLA